MGQEFRSVSAGFFWVCVSKLQSDGSSGVISKGFFTHPGWRDPYQWLSLSSTSTAQGSWTSGLHSGARQKLSLRILSWKSYSITFTMLLATSEVPEEQIPASGKSNADTTSCWEECRLLCKKSPVELDISILCNPKVRGWGESATPNYAYLRYYLINYLFLTLSVVSKIQLGPQPHILCSLAVRARRGSDPAPSEFPSARLADPASSY